MLLQILEEGKLTDNVGRVVNFRNTDHPDDLERRLGRDQDASPRWASRPSPTRAAMKRCVNGSLEEAKKTFRPEFLNRLDDVIVFRPFTKART
jgi:ATP-dependent Clp protease ATP-binding subunit ClpC